MQAKIMSYVKCPRVHALQGVKQLILSVVSTKTVRSGDLGISATHKHNRSIKIIDKLASLLQCFKSFGEVYM